jgi:gamma-glutamyltranspeptidase / glutathione hydrolase
MSRSIPWASVRAPGAMVASADSLATQAGLATAALGGTAADIAIAANAAIAVTGPHLCGLGGDLFALIHDREGVHALDAAGRAGLGVDAEALRRDGFTDMPFRHDVRSVTVPGCVDGWIELHRRFGALPLADVLAPAIDLADNGFPASPLLVASVAMLDPRGRSSLGELVEQARRPGARVRRPGVARALRAIAAEGRDGFYLGDFGRGLMDLGAGIFDQSDLATSGASWVTPLSTAALGHTLVTMPPPSQGYLALGAAALADHFDLPDDPNDPEWAHLLIEMATAVGHDRSEVLHDAAHGADLLAQVSSRSALVSAGSASNRWAPTSDGDTTYLCAVDGEGRGVSLIQSNASGFGSWLVEPSTGVNLHNRGIGFSLASGHPAEVGPGRRPPHTLSPTLVTRDDGALHALVGTMGGDAQPQIVLQLLVRLLHHRRSPADAIAAGRWALRGPVTGFDTWTSGRAPIVTLEDHAPASWRELAARGHQIETVESWDSSFGHAHAIVLDDNGMRVGAADPRSRVGSCAGTN